MSIFAVIDCAEERNGIPDAIFLLEQRLKDGNRDRLTILRLLFLYWFMYSEPSYLTNARGERDWLASFRQLFLDSEKMYLEDADYNWVVGYLLTKLPSKVSSLSSGESMVERAIEMSPDDPIPKLIRTIMGGQTETIGAQINLANRFQHWGLMGEFFAYILNGLK